jgi:hypothetical protein
MRNLTSLLLVLLTSLALNGQDVIERTYFPGAQAKNAAIAAARYAEEGYYYTKFTTYVNAIDSSRMFADTALFFVKRSMMLADTSFLHAPKSNTGAIRFLQSGKNNAQASDSIIRGYYPMVDIRSHHIFGTDASIDLSNAVMDFFNASLLLSAEADAPDSEKSRYAVLPFDDEIKRLEADETSYLHIANQYEGEIESLDNLSANISNEIALATDQKTRSKLRNWLAELENEISQSTSELQDASYRIQEIRFLLDQKYLDDVRNVEQPEHMSNFETQSTNQTSVHMNEEVPDGLVYKIQLGYYPENEDINNFHGLFPITGETVRDELARFYAGLFFSYAAASAGNKYVRQNAIANAFIVPFHNGEKISVSRAIEIERSRGLK